MRRRGGLGWAGHTVGAVARIRGRKSRILDIRTTVRGVAGVACGVGCVACGVRGVAGATSGVGCVACGVRGVAGATGTVCGMAGVAGSIGGVADTMGGATGTVCGMVCAAGDTSTSGSCVCGVAGATGGIGCPSGCVRGAAGVPDSRASPRGAARISGPVQGASHAVGGVTQVVGVVGGFSRALCGVCQIREVRGRIHTAGGELADQVLAELGQGADVVGANRQDSLEDLFTDAQSTSGAGQGLLAGRHAGAATHRRNCEDHVGQEVTNGAPGIVGPRIPVDQRLADSRHKAHGILP